MKHCEYTPCKNYGHSKREIKKKGKFGNSK